MATNAEKTKIFVDRTNPDNPIGISTRDIAQVLGYYKRDKNGKRNLGMIIKNAEINPMARCKPFRWKDAYFESAEKRAEIRGKKATSLNDDAPNNGFGPTPNVHDLSGTGISHGVYEYKRPRGVTDEYTEWFRAEDLDGYWKNAVGPMSIEFGTPYKDDNSVATIYFNDTSKGWNEKECLKIEEFLDGYSANENIALLISGGGYSWLLPSTKTAKDIQNNSLTPIIINFGTKAAAMQGNASNFHGSYLMDSNYSGLPEGTELHMAIVTSNVALPEIDPTIGIRRPISPAVGDFGSFEFTLNSDRTMLPIQSLGASEIGNLECTFAPTSWGQLVYNYDNVGGVKAYEWRNITNKLTVKTPEQWHQNTVAFTANISLTDGSTAYLDSDRNEVIRAITLEKSVYTNATANATFELTDLFGDINQYIFVPSQYTSFNYIMATVSVYLKSENRLLYSGSIQIPLP